MRASRREATSAVFAMTAAAILAFAGNSLLTRAALADGDLGPGTFTALRLLAGAVTLALIGWHRGFPFIPRTADLPAATALAAYAVAFTYAYRALGAATGALILFAVVQLTMAGVATIRGAPPRGVQAAGLVLAMAGLAWLLVPGLTAPPLVPAVLMGVAGAAWGVYTLLGRGARDPLAITARNFVATAPLAALLLIIAIDEPVNPRGIGLAVASGALTSALGYAIWYRVLPQLSVATAGVSQLLVPPVAAAGAALWLGEAPTLRLALATLAILAGIALTIRWRS